MNFDVSFSHIDYGNGIFAITAPMGEQIYLIKGEKSAALIDTGMGIGSLKEYVQKLTRLPLIVINTHGHPDHAGGNGEFPITYLHRDDIHVYHEMCTEVYRISDIRKIFKEPIPTYENAIIPFIGCTLELFDGEKIDLGGRTLEVLLTPGHTEGSVCLFDFKTGTLFSGDTVSEPANWLYLSDSTSVATYFRSVKNILKNFRDITQVLGGHPPTPVSADMVERKMRCALAICKGAVGTPIETFAGRGFLYELEGAGLIYNPNRVYDTDEKLI